MSVGICSGVSVGASANHGVRKKKVTYFSTSSMVLIPHPVVKIDLTSKQAHTHVCTVSIPITLQII